MGKRGIADQRSDGRVHLTTVRRTVRGRTGLVHVVDPPGTQFLNDRPDGQLSYLGTIKAHLLILDPRAIPAVRDRLGETSRFAVEGRGHEVLGVASIAVGELPYHVMVAKIRQYGMRTERCVLAVVVMRAELLLTAGLWQPDGKGRTSTRLRAWLVEQGFDNLVLAAKRDFRAVRYFLSSVPDAASTRYPSTEEALDRKVAVGARRLGDPAAPLEWLLDHHRLGWWRW